MWICQQSLKFHVGRLAAQVGPKEDDPPSSLVYFVCVRAFSQLQLLTDMTVACTSHLRLTFQRD